MSDKNMAENAIDDEQRKEITRLQSALAAAEVKAAYRFLNEQTERLAAEAMVKTLKERGETATPLEYIKRAEAAEARANTLKELLVEARQEIERLACQAIITGQGFDRACGSIAKERDEALDAKAAYISFLNQAQKMQTAAEARAADLEKRNRNLLDGLQPEIDARAKYECENASLTIDLYNAIKERDEARRERDEARKHWTLQPEPARYWLGRVDSAEKRAEAAESDRDRMKERAERLAGALRRVVRKDGHFQECPCVGDQAHSTMPKSETTKDCEAIQDALQDAPAPVAVNKCAECDHVLESGVRVCGQGERCTCKQVATAPVEWREKCEKLVAIFRNRIEKGRCKRCAKGDVPHVGHDGNWSYWYHSVGNYGMLCDNSEWYSLLSVIHPDMRPAPAEKPEPEVKP